MSELKFYAVPLLIFNSFLYVHQLRMNLERNKKTSRMLNCYIKRQYKKAICEYIKPDLKQVEIHKALFYTGWESDLLNLRWYFPSIFYFFNTYWQFSTYCMNQCELNLLAAVFKSQDDDIRNNKDQVHLFLSIFFSYRDLQFTFRTW